MISVFQAVVWMQKLGRTNVSSVEIINIADFIWEKNGIKTSFAKAIELGRVRLSDIE